jgi:hypothetical protein
MLSLNHLKEVVFEHFDEIEHYKINKGFTKATFEELAKMYDEAYRLGYREAISNVEENVNGLYVNTLKGKN